MVTLNELALKHGTDKSSGGHGYTALYERILGPIRHQIGTLLEIGIQHGSSHRMWRDWLPNALVMGIDIYPPACDGDRLLYFRGDQKDPVVLDRAVRESQGGFDIIIDDGSHVASDVMATFRILFKSVKPGGLYIIEDLHVGPDDDARASRGEARIKMGTSEVTALDWLKDMASMGDPIEIVDDNFAVIYRSSDPKHPELIAALR